VQQLDSTNNNNNNNNVSVDEANDKYENEFNSQMTRHSPNKGRLNRVYSWTVWRVLDRLNGPEELVVISFMNEAKGRIINQRHTRCQSSSKQERDQTGNGNEFAIFKK